MSEHSIGMTDLILRNQSAIGRTNDGLVEGVELNCCCDSIPLITEE